MSTCFGFKVHCPGCHQSQDCQWKHRFLLQHLVPFSSVGGGCSLSMGPLLPMLWLHGGRTAASFGASFEDCLEASAGFICCRKTGGAVIFRGPFLPDVKDLHTLLFCFWAQLKVLLSLQGSVSGFNWGNAAVYWFLSTAVLWIVCDWSIIFYLIAFWKLHHEFGVNSTGYKNLIVSR